MGRGESQSGHRVRRRPPALQSRQRKSVDSEQRRTLIAELEQEIDSINELLINERDGRDHDLLTRYLNRLYEQLDVLEKSVEGEKPAVCRRAAILEHIGARRG